MNRIINVIVITFLVYLIVTLIVHRGRLYQRNSYMPVRIESSKKDETFIDSFYFEKLDDFEIWRSYFKIVDYYGFGGLFAHKYIPSDSFFYVAMKYRGNENRNFCFKINNSDYYSNTGACFGRSGNGRLFLTKYNKHDSINIYLYEQPGDTSTVYLIDSVYLCW